MGDSSIELALWKLIIEWNLIESNLATRDEIRTYTIQQWSRCQNQRSLNVWINEDLDVLEMEL